MSSSKKDKKPDPLNREPDIPHLLSSFLTTSQNYDRNHCNFPSDLSSSSHQITVQGLVTQSFTISVDTLRKKFTQHQVLACLLCAGNRRHTMRTEIREVEGIDWFDGAVQNCVWEGPLMCDVLNSIGIDKSLMSWNEDEQKWEYEGHLECVAVDVECQDAPVFGGSVPLSQVMDPESKCIFAMSMNGKKLDTNRGCPVRAVFPGIIGARWVKWISRVVVRRDESQNFYQQHDYKQLPDAARDKKSAEKYWDSTPPMMDVPINSIIGMPRTGKKAKRDGEKMVTVKGYAIPHGSSGPVVRVEVSTDNGRTWMDADLDYGGMQRAGLASIRWSWCLWTARVRMSKGSGQRLLSRATDLAGNVQPEESPWNLRGVGYNAWGEVKNLEIV